MTDSTPEAPTSATPSTTPSAAPAGPATPHRPNLLGAQNTTLLPADGPDAAARAALDAGTPTADVARTHPASSLVWATLARQALDAGEDGVTLREELEICGCYMAIQRVRYRESFSYEVDVPEAMMEERVMKLLFQPLLENSIYHGVKGKTTPTRIRLRARRDDGVLSLVVEDDGLGMSAQALDKVRERLRTGYTRSGEHIGLYNTNKRIALVYGEGYGIRVDSGEGKGTRVEIRIPSGWPARGEAPQN